MSSVFEPGYFESRYLPHLSVDVVIMAYDQGKLNVLVLKTGSNAMLPGGYIEKDEDVEAAAYRILANRTGVENAHLDFFDVFGSPHRVFSQLFKDFAEQSGKHWTPDLPINKRFISLGYYALVDITQATLKPGPIDDSVHWVNIRELPQMAMDHNTIVRRAHERLKADIQKNPIAHNLLPETFTMPELHQIHQCILGEAMDRSRFQKKMLSSGLFERLPERTTEARGRNPYLYRIKP